MRILRFLLPITTACVTLTICAGLLIGRFCYWKIAPEDLAPFRSVNLETVPIQKGSEGQWKFLVLGDVQEGFSNLHGLLKKAIDGDCRLIIQTGDLVSTADEAHYRLNLIELKRAVRGLPVIIAPGNHDIRKNGRKLFERFIGARYQSFVLDSSYFIILDNALNPPNKKQILWLKKTLEASSEMTHIFVFLHRPIISWPGGPSERLTKKHAEVLQLLRQYPVDAVFTGHWHGYHSEQRDGIRFVVNGQGGDFDWEPDHYLATAFVTEVTVRAKDVAFREIKIEAQLWTFLTGRVKETFVAYVYPLVARHGFIWLLVLVLCMAFIVIKGRCRSSHL
jgi:3',5'-cyclic AMP phosphodiesterase CpdA